MNDLQIDTWRGVERYGCPHCGYQHLERGKVEDHVHIAHTMPAMTHEEPESPGPVPAEHLTPEPAPEPEPEKPAAKRGTKRSKE